LLDARARYLAATTHRIEAEAEKIRAEAAVARFALRRERLLLRLFLLALIAISVIALLDPAMVEAFGAGGVLVAVLGIVARR
jgi:hypothetical protein